MKTTSKLMCSVIFLLIVSTFALAQSPVHFAVSGKAWFAKWDFTLVDYYGEEQTESFGTAPMFGLTGAIKKDKIGAIFTIFTGSGWGYDYEFNDPAFDYTEEFEISRTDFIFAASYNFIPQLAVFAGYKNVSYTATIDYSFVDYTGFYMDESGTVEQDLSGGGFGGGVSGNVPMIPGKLSGSGSVGYFNLGGDIDTGNLSIELGLNYSFLPFWIASASYRYETYEEDIFAGPSVSVTFAR